MYELFRAFFESFLSSSFLMFATPKNFKLRGRRKVSFINYITQDRGVESCVTEMAAPIPILLRDGGRERGSKNDHFCVTSASTSMSKFLVFNTRSYIRVNKFDKGNVTFLVVFNFLFATRKCHSIEIEVNDVFFLFNLNFAFAIHASLILLFCYFSSYTSDLFSLLKFLFLLFFLHIIRIAL